MAALRPPFEADSALVTDESMSRCAGLSILGTVLVREDGSFNVLKEVWAMRCGIGDQGACSFAKCARNNQILEVGIPPCSDF